MCYAKIDMKSALLKNRKGFTLIELIVTIGVLAILLTTVLIAINPARQFAQADNTKRRSDVNAILNAISQYRSDHKGLLPIAITTTAQNISNTGTDICADILITYIPALPSDPKAANGGIKIKNCTTYDTEYQVVKDASNRITVSAPLAELTEIISITR